MNMRYITARNKMDAEALERATFTEYAESMVARGFTLDRTGAVYGKNALTGETVRDTGLTSSWSEVIETADGEWGFADPSPVRAVDDAYLKGARLREVEAKVSAESEDASIPVRGTRLREVEAKVSAESEGASIPDADGKGL